MYADTLQSDFVLPALAPRGVADIRFARRGAATALADLYQGDPLRILFPNAPAGDLITAVLVNTSGGLVAGDRHSVGVHAGPGTSALVVAQAAEKIYRSTGAECEIDVRLEAGDGAWLEWLPQESILFDGARFRRRTQVAVEGTARLMAGEMLVFGRIASGETLTHGFVRDAWEVRRDGRLVWADALHLDDDIAEALADPAAFGGARVLGTMIYTGLDAADHIDLARSLIDGGDFRAGASCVNGVLVMRWLGDDALALRTAYGRVWAAFRHAVAGHSRRLPALWEV